MKHLLLDQWTDDLAQAVGQFEVSGRKSDDGEGIFAEDPIREIGQVVLSAWPLSGQVSYARNCLSSSKHGGKTDKSAPRAE